MKLRHRWWRLHVATWVTWCGIDCESQGRPQAVPRSEPPCLACATAESEAKAMGRRDRRTG